MRALAGRPVSWGKVLIVLSTAATWFLGIVVFDSDYAFTVTNIFVHGIPYIGPRVVHVEVARGDTPRCGGRPVLRRTAWRRELVFFLALLLLVAFAEEWGWDRLVWHDHAGLLSGAARSTPGRCFWP